MMLRCDAINSGTWSHTFARNMLPEFPLICWRWWQQQTAPKQY